jgi:phosphodiesterase/alkaline phosphatase D-like protein
MASKSRVALCFLLTVVVIGKLAVARAQLAEPLQPLSRIVEPISDAKLVLLNGNTRPETRSGSDLGSVNPQLPMQRMMLLLRRSPEQEAALAEFNARQLDPSSPDFHHWLTPEEFGTLYGPSGNDIEAVTSWLQNRGFTIDNVSKGRVFIEFSGTAGLVQRAFHTEIRRYMVGGEEHIANSTDPSIPEAITPVVAGIVSLNNFLARPLHTISGTFRRDSKTGKWIPEKDDAASRTLLGVTASEGDFQLVSPYDFATIYNVLPLWNAGIDGSNQTIAIAGRSNINLNDVASFRSAFGLPAKAPTVIVNGTDPGIPSADDKTENTLDVEWSGAVAKGATIKFITTASTASSDGAMSSAAYIIDNNIAPIMSFSYGACELVFGTSGNAAINSLWQQGATEGITIFVASGAQRSGACDGSGTVPYGGPHSLAVNGAASTAYNVAVGGTDLNWYNIDNTYWNSTNATNGSSAKGYMPEVPWNATILNYNVDLDLISVAGGTGGSSSCTTSNGTTPATCSGGYAKPSWQAGTGVPADGKRDVPDVSLFASGGALLSSYVICDSDSVPCAARNRDDALMNSVGGTSVSSPAMAGIMALVNQKMGSAQGNANAAFYALAARDTRSSCNSAFVSNGSACNFYDITYDDHSVRCSPNSPNCTEDYTGDSFGVLDGLKPTVGYDLATGLGSVNAGNLVNNWHLVVPDVAKKPTATTGAASTITATTATIAGSVTANGATTHVVFAYGTSSTLAAAKKTPSVSVGSGTTAVGTSAHLTGLTAGTKYYYQLQATNSAGTTNGAIKSFTTAKKPTATTEAASTIGGTTATIAGSVTPNGADTHYLFAYGTSSTLAGAKKTTSVDIGSGTTAVGVSAHLKGLTAGTKYYYQVQATNSVGATIGTIKSFTTAKKPTATTGAASSIAATTATVAGSVTPNGADTHFAFAYGTSSTLAGAKKTTSVDIGSGAAAVGVSVHLTGLTAGTKYYYQVQATNSVGTTNGSINSFTTGAAVTKPTATTGAASSITAATATIAGSVNPNGADTHFAFAYGTSSALAGAKKTTSVDVGSGKTIVGVSVNLTSLTAGTKYYYQAQATNSAGTTNGAINSFTTAGTAAIKPTATTGAASSITAATATIAGSVNPNGADTHFVFAYGTNSNLSGAKNTTSVDIGSGKTAVGVSVNLTGLTSNTKYYYRVQATNGAGTTNGAINSFTTIATGWSGEVVCKKTVTGPSYSNNDTQTWTVAPGIPQAPTGQTIYPTQWKSTGSGSTATQTWVINSSGSGEITVFTNTAGLNFARYSAEIVFPNGYQSTPPPNYTDYEYQWQAFGNSDANATHVQGSNSLTSPACDSPVEPGGSSCTVTCSWNFNKQ